jgi:hypothetical protein
LTSWFPPCAPGTCAAVPIIWAEYAKKPSWSFFIPVILLQFVRIFCSALSDPFLSFLSNFPIVTSCCHHNISSPHHHTTTRDRTALPNLTSPSGILLITFNLSKGIISLRLYATWRLSKLISPHHHKANHLARTKFHQPFVK